MVVLLAALRVRKSVLYQTYHKSTKVKISMFQAVGAHRVVRRRDLHIFYIIGSQMATRISPLRAGRPLSPEGFLVHIYITKCLNKILCKDRIYEKQTFCFFPINPEML
jgi:hypothetical protein